MDLTAKATAYVLISKKYFTRYVLIYDVLPLDLCYTVDGKPFFGTETLRNLLAHNKISEREVILELKVEGSAPYAPLSDLISIGFTTQDSLNVFKERSYDNFDVGLLNCRVMEVPEAASRSDIEAIPPASVDKFSFSEKMALGDAVTALAHNQLLYDTQPAETTEKHLLQTEGTVDYLLGTTEAEPAKRELAASFFSLCARYNLDKGWPTRELLDTFEEESSPAVKQTDEFKLWLSTARRLLNNEEVHIPFSDDGDITLRAMTLVFLNPEQHNLEAMRGAVGSEVYKLAEKFILARSGYSYLSAEDRVKIGEARPLLQQFNARFHNPAEAQQEQTPEQHEEITPADGQQAEVGADSNGMDLRQHSWLTFGEENEQGEVIRIKGIKPTSGFSLDLVYREKQWFALRIIDASGPKKMDKFKGKLAEEMVNVQKDLPDSSRFEKNEYGLFLTLPLAWAESADLKCRFEELFDVLKALKIKNQRTKIA